MEHTQIQYILYRYTKSRNILTELQKKKDIYIYTHTHTYIWQTFKKITYQSFGPFNSLPRYENPFSKWVVLYPPQSQVSGVCLQLHVNLSELPQCCSLDNQSTPVISPAQQFLWPLPVIVPASSVQLQTPLWKIR